MFLFFMCVFFLYVSLVVFCESSYCTRIDIRTTRHYMARYIKAIISSERFVRASWFGVPPGTNKSFLRKISIIMIRSETTRKKGGRCLRGMADPFCPEVHSASCLHSSREERAQTLIIFVIFYCSARWFFSRGVQPVLAMYDEWFSL